MSKVRIYGDVSGYVDIAVPDNAGTTTLNLDKIPQADINGNIAMDTNTLYVDAANNRVGVGTASPNTALDIVSPGGAEAINIRGRSADDIGQLKFYENDGTTSLARLDSRTTHFEVGSYNELRFSAGGVGNSHVVIDTSGNIFFGANKTANLAQVGLQYTIAGSLAVTRDGGAAFSLNRLTSDGELLGLWKDTNKIGYLGSNTTAGQSLLDISSENDSSSNIRFLTYGSGAHNEVMRLASNKMVGIGITAPTASWGNGTGVQFNPAGEVLASKVNGTSLYLNRTSSSGSNRAVISINENSSNIGNIGIGSGSELAISTNAGIQYISQKINNDTDGIQYSNSGTYHFGPWLSKNDTVDLGRSNSGWRDLYLTGGIQFDARSNKLDDYEEGNFSPNIQDNSNTNASNYVIQVGVYRKIGGLVYFAIDLRNINANNLNGSDAMKVSGLPFTSASSGSLIRYPVSYAPGNSNGFGGETNLSAYVNAGTDDIYLLKYSSGLTSPAPVTITELLGSSTNRDFWIAGTYPV